MLVAEHLSFRWPLASSSVMLFWRSASPLEYFNLEPKQSCPVRLGSEAKFPLLETSGADSNCKAHSVKPSGVLTATWLLSQN